MRLFILAILLGFPLLEGTLLYTLATGGHGGWILAWLLFAAAAGMALIQQARFALVARLGQALACGQYSIAALIDSFRAVIAGLLLIFPGILSDVLALGLMMMPVREPALARARPTADNRRAAYAGKVIEGEFRRLR